jgi:subtilisin family serine protease
LAKAQVILYGGLPVQGETDQNGEVTLAVFGAVASVEAMYVKPFADYWEKWILQPALKDGRGNVISLDPLSAFQPAHFPGNPYIGWGQRLLGLSDDLGKNFSSKGVRVAIIDSGCDNRHPSLTHITRGLDYTKRDAADVPDPTSWTTDTLSHGTHCAGIIAGNGNGLRGFAPDAEVHVLKLFPGGRFDDLISALKYCIDSNIDVVNCSLGSDNTSEAVQQWMERARQAGVAVVVAAGNSSGPVQFPASLSDVFCVSAVGQQGDFPADTYHQQTIPSGPGVIGVNGIFAARFSCFGPQVKVCGPGVAIISSVPGGGYAAWDGTSMAAPHIAGLAALVAAQPRFSTLTRNAAKVDLLFQTILGSAANVGLDSLHAGAGLPSAPLALNPPRLAAGNMPGAVTSDDQASKQMLELIIKSVVTAMLPSAGISL